MSDEYQYLEEPNVALVRAVGHPRSVLDIGCGRGQNTAHLVEEGARVVGLESDPRAVESAREKMSAVHSVDIEDDSATTPIANEKFDLIVLGDVLEHTRDPEGVLRRFLPFLEDGGHVIISLPNVAAWTVRLSLLGGRWRYADRGILDRTHLRFFDRDTATNLARSVGLEVLSVNTNPLLVRAASELVRPFVAGKEGGTTSLADNPLYQKYLQWVRPAEEVVASAWPELLGFQHVVIARVPPTKRKLSLTVGMISMNEEGAVGGVIDDIRKHAPDAEVLLVDSSKDRTPEIAADKGARVIRQVPPKGYGPAMMRLLYSATTDVIITMDCDGTYPADRIMDLHRRIEEGADLVNTTRTFRRPEAMPLPNYIANRVFAGGATVLHGVRTTDVHSGMRAYRTSMLRALDIPAKGAALPVELLVAPARLGYKLEEVEIPYFERIGNTTLRRFESTLWTFRRLAMAYRHGGSRAKGR